MVMATSPTIAVIGSGNMGSSIIGGLIKKNYPSQQIWASDQNPEKLAALKKQFSIQVTNDNLIAVKKADIVILAIKPQIMAEVLIALANAIQAQKPLVISIAAGISENSLANWLKKNIAIIRAMPNTPACIGEGATALYANQWVKPSDREIAENILSALGLVVWIEDEKMMDVVTALSGSGPAYFFLMMECLQQAAQEMGLNEEIARMLTLQTAYGATRMARDSQNSLQELRKEVTSPGGTTEKAITVLENNHIRDLFRKALQAAKIQSEAIAQKMGK